MKDKRTEERIQHSLNAALSGLRTTSYQRDQFFENATGGYKVKGKISVVAILVAVLMLITATALAATGTFQKLWEVWQSSFQKMNTTGAIEIVENFNREAFEKEYGGVKDDLIISTVPKEGDLDYDRAYAIGRQAIMDQFGTPTGELDAMGIYPNFYASPYQDESGEWELYFSPRRNVNIDEDHTYDAPGEYMVRIASPSGKVTDCFWYIDDFWPDYALRTWNAGKHDYVYKKAVADSAFYAMPQEQQKNFLALFTEAGYDAKPLQKDLETLLNGSLWRAVTWADSKDNLLSSDSPAVQAVLKAMEKEYGFSKAQMEMYDFNLLPSPIDSETEDYCLTYNYNLCYPRFKSGVMGEYELSVNQYPERLGFWVIRLDPSTHAVIGIEHVNKTMDEAGFLPSDKLLGRAHWSVSDLQEYETLRQQAIQIDRESKAGNLTKDQARGKFDTLMREYGASPADYPWQEDGTGRLRKADALEIANQYLSMHYPKFSVSMFDHVACRMTDQDSYYKTPYYQFDYFIGDNPAYEIIIHADSGEILYSSGPKDGNG